MMKNWITLWLLILSVSSTYGQSEQGNSLIAKNGKVYALVPIEDIEKGLGKYVELDKYKALTDSLIVEVWNRDKVIKGQEERLTYFDGIITKNIDIQELSHKKYKLLQEDYKIMFNKTRLRFAFGGSSKLIYNLDSKKMDVGADFSVGVKLKSKHLITGNIGITLQRNVVVGFSYFIVL